jgi:hypothetical protein
MIVDKYGNYVRKCMWQLSGWSRVDICITFHVRALDFFSYIVCPSRLVNIKMTKFYVEKVVPNARKL